MQSEENILALLNQVEQQPHWKANGRQMPEDGLCIRGKILWKETEVLVVEGWSLSMSKMSERKEDHSLFIAGNKCS